MTLEIQESDAGLFLAVTFIKPEQINFGIGTRIIKGIQRLFRNTG